MELGIVAICVTILGICLYFLPAFVARGKENSGLIFFLNLIIGWTGIFWFALVVWAAVSPQRSTY